MGLAGCHDVHSRNFTSRLDFLVTWGPWFSGSRGGRGLICTGMSHDAAFEVLLRDWLRSPSQAEIWATYTHHTHARR